MSDPAREHSGIVDTFTNLTADITHDPGNALAQRLRSLAGSAGRPADPVVLVARSDERETLLSGRLIDSLSGLSPGERLGPFVSGTGIDVWLHVYFAARRTEVTETGATAPAFVFTEARPPVIAAGTTAIDIEAGTVWIRGDLISAGLPAAAYVGVKVDGGTLRLKQPAVVTGDVVTGDVVTGDVVAVTGPITGTLELLVAPDDATPAPGTAVGCLSSGAKTLLPSSLAIHFGSGANAVKGSSGKAKAWGQTFDFSAPAGGWTFVERLWTVVLGYDVSPEPFDADPIGDDLVRFSGKGSVSGGGLGLPVVLAPNPAILGEAARFPEWLLHVKGLKARWYDADPRPHTLAASWVSISSLGATIVAEGIAPLAPPVTHTYDLWTIAGGGDKRLPWRQTYRAPFWLLYRCHMVAGEHLMVEGHTTLALDRPVTTNGVPIATRTAHSVLLLHQLGGKITAMLGASVDDDHATHQFALRNALVWTTAPSSVFVRGTVTTSNQIDAGDAQLLFGVYAWVPTLPDPYVANAFISRPNVDRAAPRSVLFGRVSWSTPDNVAVSFEGRLGSGPALGGRSPSPGDPRPAHKSHGDPEVGLTQVEQSRQTLDRSTAAQWKAAQAAEAEERGRRADIARQENQKINATVSGYLAEVVGPAPSLLLLDVSTNQDLLGVAVGARNEFTRSSAIAPSAGDFLVADLAVHAPVGGMRVVALPQVQWEPVRTLDADQDVMTMGWFPTPLASATDGGATQIGARSQKLVPVIPADALQGTLDAYRDGTPVGVRTTFPFGLVAAIRLQPTTTATREADLYGLTRPAFPDVASVGGIQITARAEGGRASNGGISPMFEGWMGQLLNGVDLPSGTPLGISVLGETLSPAGSVETVFNNDMAARPRVPVTRIDLSGYGGSNFSDWNNPFAAFAEAAKVQFRLIIGRTSLEVIKVNSVLHPWGVRVTRSVTIERRPGGGVIRRDSGWQAFTPGIFDYRYFDTGVNDIVVAPYRFDAGFFRGLFNARAIRPAPGTVVNHGAATLVPYYFDADVAIEGVDGRTPGIGILGYLQTTPNGVPADASALAALIEAQGPIGGPLDTWLDFGGSGLPFRAQRIEVGLAMDGGNPLFVATVRGVPKLPKTGAWSVVSRPVASVPVNGGEAVPVAENRGVPLIRRYPVEYFAGDDTVFTEPPLVGSAGDYRFADAADLLAPAAPANDYALLHSTPTHAFLFPRPSVPAGGAPRVDSGHKTALADIIARSTSKGAFPPPGNTIELPAGSLHFDVGPQGTLALSAPVSVVGHPTPLRIAGTPGHGSSLFYDLATLRLELTADRWEAEFTGLRIWTDITGLARVTGSEMRIVGSTDQRPQIAEITSLMLQEIEDILRYIPIFGARGVQGPIDLGASNAKHELKVEAQIAVTIPPTSVIFPAGAGVKLKLFVKQSTGIDTATGGAKASATFGGQLEGKVPLLSVGVATVFLIVAGEITFSLTSVSGTVTSEKLELMAFVGIGVEGKIGPFRAYAFLGVGFVLVYDATIPQTKYGGLVALEAGVDLVIVGVKIRAELKGLVYQETGKTKCDYSGSVKIQVDIFLIFSISATYQVTETTSF